MIPAITETSTRLPAGAPLVSGPDAPELQAATGVLFLLFLLGAALQVWRLRTSPIPAIVTAPSSPLGNVHRAQ